VKRVAALVLVAACGGDDAAEVCDPGGDLCQHLSSYALFDDIPAQTPAAGVVPYELNTQLFSDYTTKYRFVSVPDGDAMTWDDEASFDMPVGTILVKTFAYLEDRREPDGARDLLETRLLIHTDDGWDAASYVYDADDGDARLAVAGATIQTAWIHDDGEARDNAYTVPNKNQCKNCHEEVEDELGPLGPKARRINHDGQLEELIELGMLDGAPDPDAWPRDPAFDARRARPRVDGRQLQPLPQPDRRGPHQRPRPARRQPRAIRVRRLQRAGRRRHRLGRAAIRHRPRRSLAVDPDVPHRLDGSRRQDAGARPEPRARRGSRADGGVDRGDDAGRLRVAQGLWRWGLPA